MDKRGPAARAGLRPGDFITEVDAKKVNGSRELVRMISSCAGDKIEVKALRDGQEKTFSVVVEEKEAPARITPDQERILEAIPKGELKRFDEFFSPKNN